MKGLYERDYTKLKSEEIEEKEKIDAENTIVTGTLIAHRTCFSQYPKAVRHNLSLFPNNYLDINFLKNEKELRKQCDGFEKLLNDNSITELDIKRYIQNNGYYSIPGSIFERFQTGHHEAVLFKEFSLGTEYKADYLLLGRSSCGWQFIFVEYENPYGHVIMKNGDFGEIVRKGINQVKDWERFVEGNFNAVYRELKKYTNKDLPQEFITYESARVHYVVVAGRRKDFDENEKTRSLQLGLRKQNIMLLHYDNILDDTIDLIGKNTY